MTNKKNDPRFSQERAVAQSKVIFDALFSALATTETALVEVNLTALLLATEEIASLCRRRGRDMGMTKEEMRAIMACASDLAGDLYEKSGAGRLTREHARKVENARAQEAIDEIAKEAKAALLRDDTDFTHEEHARAQATACSIIDSLKPKKGA